MLDDTELYIDPVTLYEFVGATDAQKWIVVKTLTDDILVLHFSKSISKKAAFIYQELKKENKIIDLRDIFIAATAMVNDLRV